MILNSLKTFAKSLLIPILFLGFWTNSHAQIDKVTNKILKKVEGKAAKKAEDKAEEKAEEAVDKGVDKAFDKLFKKMEKAIEGDSTSNKKEDDAKSTGTASSENDTEVKIVAAEPDPNVEPSEWIGSLTMKVEETKNGKLQEGYPQTTTFHVDKYKVAFENKQADQNMSSIVIIDRKYRKMTTKSIDENGAKRAFTMPMPAAKVQVEDKDGEINDARDNYRKTGRTKTIAGYRCEEYVYENENTESSIWLSKTMGADFRKFFSWISIQDNKTGGYSSYDEFYPMSGAIMESTTIEKDKGTKNHMIVENVRKGKVDGEAFSLDGYEHQDMSEIMNSPEGKKVGDFFKKLSDKVEAEDNN